MSNTYCNSTQFGRLYDTRAMAQLSNDANQTAPDTQTIQFHLDVAASKMDMVLTGRYPLPLVTIPLALTQWVAISAIGSIFGRRAEMPEGIVRELDWAEQFVKDLIDRKILLPGTTPPGMSIVSDSSLAESNPQGSITENIAFFSAGDKKGLR